MNIKQENDEKAQAIANAGYAYEIVLDGTTYVDFDKV